VRIGIGGGDELLALLDRVPQPRGLVLVVPGLGGDAEGLGPRRLALALRCAGCATLRLNLRGAGAGRSLAGGTYAARCDRDLAPVLAKALALAEQLGAERQREQAGEHVGEHVWEHGGEQPPLPLAAAGLSLGGTILLNAIRAGVGSGLTALACLSSPLDLAGCSAAIGRPRNALYERWLVRRLRRQTLADPLGLAETERRALAGADAPRTIRGFDGRITAPRWGYASVDAYYAAASPLADLHRWAQEPDGARPAILLVHAADDPWVPAGPTRALVGQLPVLLTAQGGHCGFHGVGDPPQASWSDRLLTAWLLEQITAAAVLPGGAA
jgi:predicted alpha/beta-fold hydrolase